MRGLKSRLGMQYGQPIVSGLPTIQVQQFQSDFSLLWPATLADRISLTIRTLQHTGLPHPVLSSSTSVSFISRTTCKTSEKRDQLGSGEIDGARLYPCRLDSRKGPPYGQSVNARQLQSDCSGIANPRLSRIAASWRSLNSSSGLSASQRPVAALHPKGSGN